MVLKKITNENSVRHLEQTREKDIKPKTIKAGSLPRIQTKIIHKTKKILNKVAASGFATLRK